MRYLLALAVALLALAGCGGGNDQATPDSGWPGWGNAPENDHFAPLDQIDRPVDGHEVNWPDVSARTVALWNVTGLPALSLPIGTGDDGLPVGMQIVGPPHGDERCLALAQLVERSVVNAM